MLNFSRRVYEEASQIFCRVPVIWRYLSIFLYLNQNGTGRNKGMRGS